MFNPKLVPFAPESSLERDGMNFRGRRIRNIGFLVIAIALITLLFEVISLSLQTQQYYSGWVLVTLIICLLAFYLKKKLSVVPLGSSAIWAQWHYYGGVFLIAVFLIHIEFSFPDGNVEIMLTSLLALVFLSGIIGVKVNRIFAVRLSYLSEEVIFERIPEHLAKLKEELEQQLLESVKTSQSSTLSDYYLEHLSDYFSTHSDRFAHLVGNRKRHLRRLNDLELQMRYLNQGEADFAIRLRHYLEQKNILDTHYVLQSVLKYWGVLHGPVSVLLLLMVFLHVVLVYAFRGAM